MNYYHEKRYKISKKNSYSNDLHNNLNNRTFIKGKQVLTIRENKERINLYKCLNGYLSKDPTIFSKDPTIREKTQKGEMNNNL